MTLEERIKQLFDANTDPFDATHTLFVEGYRRSFEKPISSVAVITRFDELRRQRDEPTQR